MKLINHLGQEVEITSDEDLSTFLSECKKFGQVILNLVSVDFGNLTIGIGHIYGFVEYINAKAEPPYLLAKQKNDEGDQIDDEYIEFNAGGTVTPIPNNLCIPMNLVERVTLYFYKKKELPTFVDWSPI